MSAALNTIDHSVLVKCLSCSFGVAGNVLSWIQSYLTGRTQSVRIGSHSSPPNPCSVAKALLGSFLHNILHLFPPLLIHTKSLSSSTRTTRNSMLLFCQLITAKTFLHLSPVWTLFAFGLVKMAWPSTQQPIPRLYPAPAFIIFDRSSKSVHL